ncbi:MAG: response regulator [Gemmatimonadaceae bacterium]|nr:response regulator [Gemmatimonadaceae bacterium]MBA3645885.1 response regulator [Gemmatimonadaceae bacterium]
MAKRMNLTGKESRSGKDRRQSARPVETEEVAPLQREVLLVDDDAELQSTIKFGLESGGYTVTTFDSGPEAFGGILALPIQRQPRLILLAINLPGLDGHTLHEELVRARPGEFIVAFLSTRNSDTDQVRAFAAGAVDFIVKPASIPILLAKVKVWFDRCEQS